MPPVKRKQSAGTAKLRSSVDPLLAALAARDSRPDSAGEATRRRILEHASAIASRSGLEGLTVGELAKQLKISKSGLFAHFGSKEELQLAVVQHASRRFVDEIVRPALEHDRGLPRLRAMVEFWLGYVERNVFPGGCFFAAASLEFDGRAGPVRDHVAEVTAWWFDAVAGEVAESRRRGQLQAADPDLLAFRLHGYVQEANWGYQMFRDDRWFVRARAAIDDAIRQASTEITASRP
ncbi:MAG: TetR/AcrR family transcriptional regulator [Bryobacteraceae bacterium]